MTRVADVRILHLFANHKWTGPADPAIRLAARLRSLGIDVVFAQAEFVHRGGSNHIARQLWDWRVPVIAGLELRKHFHAPSLLRDVRALRTILLRDGIRVLHCHQPSDHLLAALACRKLSRPPIIVRTLYEPEPPGRSIRTRFSFSRTAGVIAPTNAARRGVINRFGLAADRVLLQSPVTEPQPLVGQSLRSQWGLEGHHRLVGITARVQPHRRFDLLWEIARRVVDVLPNARFALFGRGNEADMNQLVLAPLQRFGLQQHVLLPGYKQGDDYRAALRSCDAFLFLVPGSDGTCRAVADALALGLPVVATSRGILPELLAERRAGEIFGVACREDAATMAKELVQLLRDDTVRAARSAAARRCVLIDMNPHAAAMATAAFYEQLLAEAAR
ncbi:MAG: glycosyltransferase [Planctomycetes bacterium]|nr:glycosyltransferase [Planctomycetota bacterium]